MEEGILCPSFQSPAPIGLEAFAFAGYVRIQAPAILFLFATHFWLHAVHSMIEMALNHLHMVEMFIDLD